MSSKRRNTNDFDQNDNDSIFSGFSDISNSKKSKATSKSDDETDEDELDDNLINRHRNPQSRTPVFDCLQCQPFKVKCHQYSIASLERAPTKRSSQFQIELNLRNYSTNLQRNDIFDKLIADFKDLYCIVALEENESQRTKYRSAKKFKIFLNTKYTQKRIWSSEELYYYFYHMLREFVGEEQAITEQDLSISSSTMDNDKRPEIVLTKPNTIPEAIKWSTIDFDPRFTNNFDPSTFSESYRIEKWARDHIDKPFSLDMAFVREGGFRKSKAELKAYLEEHKCKHHKRHINMPLDIGPFNDWRDEVTKWWNNWCEPNAWYPKKPQMLIIGPDSNTGKTMFVTQALFRGADAKNEIPREAILIPERAGNTRSVSTFAWQKAKPAYHSVIYCDEFEIGYYNTETLKIVLEGSFFNPQIKMKCSGDDIQLAIPAIFISNTDIPEFDTFGKDMKPLLKRFQIVRIPKNAKQYKSNHHNPYIKLFEEKRLNVSSLGEEQKEHEEEHIATVVLDQTDVQPNLEGTNTSPTDQNPTCINNLDNFLFPLEDSNTWLVNGPIQEQEQDQNNRCQTPTLQYENPVETLFNPQPIDSYLPNSIQNRANNTLLDNIAESNNAFENNFQNHESTNQEVRETEFNLEHFLSEIIDDMLSKMFF